MKLRYTLYILLSMSVITACNDNEQAVMADDTNLITLDGADLHSEIEPFVEVGDNVSSTRAHIDGDKFETKDLMRLRVIAPYVASSEYGESTWGNSYDNWRLYTWKGAEADWGQVTAAEFGFDVDNDFNPTNAPSSIIMPQATPFVFTATTFTEEIHHVIPSTTSAGTVVLSFSNVFKADQRRIENYKASDVLWAQQYMQTGSDNVRLSFKHKMAALRIDISDFASSLTTGAGAEEVVLTLEYMPDIDQQEVTIGNYYAEKMKDKRAYGDYYRTKCSYENNGKVLGIVVPDEAAGYLVQIPFTDPKIPQTGVYTAYKLDAKTFLLVIPPYTVPATITPTLWLRQGEKRWSAVLPLPDSEKNAEQTNRTFESGVRYWVSMKKPVVTPDPKP